MGLFDSLGMLFGFNVLLFPSRFVIALVIFIKRTLTERFGYNEQVNL